MRNSTMPLEATRLSATADYALRAVLALAGSDARRRADTIADAIGAPRNYLAKVLNGLAKAGVVTSARGPAGGFALAIPADRLTIARVVAPFNEAPRHPRCLLGCGPCDPARPCVAHARWTAMTAPLAAAFATTTIADLLRPAPLTRDS